MEPVNLSEGMGMALEPPQPVKPVSKQYENETVRRQDDSTLLSALNLGSSAAKPPPPPDHGGGYAPAPETYQDEGRIVHLPMGLNPTQFENVLMAAAVVAAFSPKSQEQLRRMVPGVFSDNLNGVVASAFVAVLATHMVRRHFGLV